MFLSSVILIRTSLNDCFSILSLARSCNLYTPTPSVAFVKIEVASIPTNLVFGNWPSSYAIYFLHEHTCENPNEPFVWALWCSFYLFWSLFQLKHSLICYRPPQNNPTHQDYTVFIGSTRLSLSKFPFMLWHPFSRDRQTGFLSQPLLLVTEDNICDIR